MHYSKLSSDCTLGDHVTIDYTLLEEEVLDEKGRDCTSKEPVTDVTEALELLYTNFLDGAALRNGLCLIPCWDRARAGSGRKKTVIRLSSNVQEGRKVWSRVCGPWLPCLTSSADELISKEWVEETSVINVFKISLLGIAIYAARRLKKLEAAVGGTTNDSE